MFRIIRIVISVFLLLPGSVTWQMGQLQGKPVLNIPLWLFIWIAINIISGLVAAHTVMNKVTGIVLFILPLTITRIDLKYSGALVSAVATFAAIQEGHYIRTGIIDCSLDK